MTENFLNDNSSILKIHNGDESSFVVGNVENYTISPHWVPQLGRPRVDTLKASRHANIKELRFSVADGEWRVAFAFDPRRRAILPVAGEKSGESEKRFYRELIRKADDRFDAHLARTRRET